MAAPVEETKFRLDNPPLYHRMSAFRKHTRAACCPLMAGQRLPWMAQDSFGQSSATPWAEVNFQKRKPTIVNIQTVATIYAKLSYKRVWTG